MHWGWAVPVTLIIANTDPSHILVSERAKCISKRSRNRWQLSVGSVIFLSGFKVWNLRLKAAVVVSLELVSCSAALQLVWILLFTVHYGTQFFLSYCHFECKEFAVVSLALDGDSFLDRTSHVHLHSSSWGHASLGNPAIWSHVNEMVNDDASALLLWWLVVTGVQWYVGL